jgi:hypothetical protein
MDMKRFFLYFITIAALALAGCGGNGGPGVVVDTTNGTGNNMCAEGQTGTYPACMDPAGPTAAQRMAAMLIAPAIVNPDGNKDEDGEAIFPEVGDLTHEGRPTSGTVEVDNVKRTVSIAQTTGILPDITDIPVVKVGDLTSLMSGDNEWLGSHHVRVINNKAEEAVVYTNVKAAGPRVWTDHYDGTARSGTGTANANDTTGEVELVTEDDIDTMDTNELEVLLDLIDIPALPMGNSQYKDFEEDDGSTGDTNEGQTPGMFMGIPGMFECTQSAGCTVRTDDEGNISTLGGTWTFTPTTADEEGMMISDVMVQGVEPDADYMYFGYWAETTTGDDASMGVRTFYGGMDPYELTNITNASLEGSATYNGRAAGVFVTKDDMGPANSGEFTANATLTANFGGDDIDMADRYQIDGSVTGFVLMDGDTMVANTWMLTLNPAQFSTRTHDAGTGMVTAHENPSSSTFSGTTDGGAGADNAGEWNGMFFGASTDDANADIMPSGVAGEFLGHFSNGHALGAFGADMVPEAMDQ